MGTEYPWRSVNGQNGTECGSARSWKRRDGCGAYLNMVYLIMYLFHYAPYDESYTTLRDASYAIYHNVFYEVFVMCLMSVVLKVIPHPPIQRHEVYRSRWEVGVFFFFVCVCVFRTCFVCG